ncbi:helix-turn-helix domain-containing protein [Lutibacter agarilyticus]|uniref:helix-turn-helix domain-containing protein n=1 Tax=Lutibacter agarilyticus TaxID=1109740 RepID=UPI001FEBF1D9|nr:helix-turn-helix transcriptional regulator [Lutibacter agarilyticus]
MNYLSKNIRYIRTLKGLTQEQFADDLKVSRSRISSYEENRAKPSIRFLIELSSYCKISMELLVKEKLNKLEL